MPRLPYKTTRIYYRNQRTLAIQALKKGVQEAVDKATDYMYMTLKKYFEEGGPESNRWEPVIIPGVPKEQQKKNQKQFEDFLTRERQEKWSRWLNFRNNVAPRYGTSARKGLLKLAAENKLGDYGLLSEPSVTYKVPLGGIEGKIFKGIKIHRNINNNIYKYENVIVSAYIYSMIHEFGMHIKIPPGGGPIPPMVLKLWSLGFRASIHKTHVVIPARPFMGPAAEETRRQFPEITRRYITASMREFLPPITAKGEKTEVTIP